MYIRFSRIVSIWVLFSFLLAFLFITLTSKADVQFFAPLNNETRFFVGAAAEPNAIANETIRLLCFEDDNAEVLTADIKVQTDEKGTAILPDTCTDFAALQPVETVPAGKRDQPAATIYRTSFEPNSKDVEESAPSEVVLGNDDYLILFHVVVSLAWEPTPDSDYVENLQTGLQRASTFLFDVTDGRMAFGEISIHTNGRFWDQADIRIKAANDFRPAAYVGGIISEINSYTSATNVGEVVYKPGAIFFGRNWTRYGSFFEPDEGWASEDSYKTITHEWAHYGLFLYDEYISPLGNEVFCTFPNKHPDAGDEVASTASILEWHYNSSEFWLNSPPEAGCENSLQFAVHGVYDWDALDQWETIMGLPTNYVQPPNAGPEGVPIDNMTRSLFGSPVGYMGYLPILFQPGTPPPQAGLTQDALLALVDPAAQFGENGVEALSQVYVINMADSSNLAAQIIHQGGFIKNGAEDIYGEMEVVGVSENSQLRVFFDRYGDERAKEGENYVFLEEVPLVSLGGVVELKPNPWAASLNYDWEFAPDGRLTTMIITITSSENTGLVTFQLCVPEAEVGCFWVEQAAPNQNVAGDFEWIVRFDVDETAKLHPYQEVPLYAIVRAFDEQGGELIDWYQVAGGVGPGHMFVDAPMVEGPVMVNTLFEFGGANTAVTQGNGEAVVGPCSRVIYSPASNNLARLFKIPAGAFQFVAQPLDIDIFAANEFGQCEFNAGDHDMIAPMTVSFMYNQDWADTVGVKEDNLALVQFIRPRNSNESAQWVTVFGDVPGNLLDQEMNRLSIPGITRDGIFAVIAQE